jgi:AraC-like DNA-binding protein/ligand-binding sensor protein
MELYAALFFPHIAKFANSMDKPAIIGHPLSMMIGKLGILFNEEVQRLFDSFTYCFKVRTVFFSVEVEALAMGIPSDDQSSFCKLVRAHHKERCVRQDKMMCPRCKDMDAPYTYQCYAGPSESVLPIKVDSVLIGYAMVGQFRMRETLGPGGSLDDRTIKDLQTGDLQAGSGIDANLLRSTFLELPLFDKTDLENVLHLFSAIITFIVNEGYIRSRYSELAGNIVHWLDKHITEPVSLAEAAAAVYRSRSSVSHVIKAQFGISFKQLCTLKRIEKFEHLVTAKPDITIAEAAYQAGYKDALYFSRQYKKVRRRSPSSYIKSLQKPVEIQTT